MQVAVIISTYNQPEWLEKCLIGYSVQDFSDFAIVVADDGSGPETRERIDSLRSRIEMPLHHVWHEDRGFRKCTILNKAIADSEAEYLIFTDGDCIPRRDFVSVHLRYRAPGYFLSGGYFKLPMCISRQIDHAAIEAGSATDPRWLVSRGLRRSRKLWKLRTSGALAQTLNALTPTRPSWNGHNASTWREGLLRVNGFDERMGYYGEDRELGERLMNAGLRPRQIRYSAVCVHLDHARGYKRPEVIAVNDAIRAETRRRHATWTDFGIRPRGGPDDQLRPGCSGSP